MSNLLSPIAPLLSTDITSRTFQPTPSPPETLAESLNHSRDPIVPNRSATRASSPLSPPTAAASAVSSATKTSLATSNLCWRTSAACVICVPDAVSESKRAAERFLLFSLCRATNGQSDLNMCTGVGCGEEKESRDQQDQDDAGENSARCHY